MRVDRRRTAARSRPASSFVDPVQRVPGRAHGVRRVHDGDLLAAVHADRAGARPPHRRTGCASTTACTSCSISRCCVALLTNNMGILWVAMEAATLATVLLVSLYRTPASLEAAWKYFILCGVGIAQALFGTILLYFAAEKLLGAGGGALLWTRARRRQGPARADGAVARVRVPAGRLRHQGRARAAAQLAARRARRGPDAGVGGAVRAAAQRRAVRGRALQGAGRGLAAHARSRAS